MSTQAYAQVSGTAKVSNADADETVISAPSSGRIRVLSGVITVTVASSGGAGIVALEDGVDGTQIFKASAAAVGVHPIDFGELGYPLTADTALNLTVEGATTQATARATIVGIQS